MRLFTRPRFSWLDVKLGLRMLPKHPVLNLAAIFALAIGIPVGLAPAHLARALTAPLPGDAENRVRAIRYWDPATSAIAPTWDSDFEFWRQNLHSFSSVGAFRTSMFNISAGDETTSAAGAQLSAAVLPMLGARPQLGRTLQPADFTPGAPDVVVIGYSLWSSRFGQAREVLGRTIRVGDKQHIIVGVMPDGFAFPNNEALWLPLRLASLGGAANSAQVQVIARLADGATIEQAQAELSARGKPPVSSAAAADEAAERARVRAEVVPFGFLFLGLPAGGLASLPEFRYMQALMLVLLLVACGNVAMLIFARTATRLRELAIRSALGASRTRIISQIFVETLLLAVIAAGAGVLSFDWALTHVDLARIAGATAMPFWLSLHLTRETAFTAVALAVVSATVAGVVPAIFITRRAIAQNIRGTTRVPFGRLTAGLLVADIAVSVAAIGTAFAVSAHATDLDATKRATGIDASQYLAVEFRLPEEHEQAKLATTQRELIAALEREPGVLGVAAGDALPRMEHRSRQYEIETLDNASAALRWTRVARVDVGYFDALGTPVLGGRNFVRTDAESSTRVAIVNTAFVQRALNGRDPIGTRVRFPNSSTDNSSDWYQIVGVVGPLGVNLLNPERGEAVYVAAPPGSISPLHVAIHTRTSPANLMTRVRELAFDVDPDVVVGDVSVLSDVRPGDWYLVMGLVAGLIALVLVLVALATSSIYAMLSLSVTERTREIGIRAALGAPPRALLNAILRRSLVQIAIGATIGLPIAARSVFELTRTQNTGGNVLQSTGIALALSIAIVAMVGLGSCLVPGRRILAIEASVAMRAEGN